MSGGRGGVVLIQCVVLWTYLITAQTLYEETLTLERCALETGETAQLHMVRTLTLTIPDRPEQRVDRVSLAYWFIPSSLILDTRRTRADKPPEIYRHWGVEDSELAQ
jgi:hypothetical protein